MTTNEVRGRIMSLLLLNMGVAQALTLPIAALGQSVSLETLFPIMAFICLGAVAAIVLTHPAIWRARSSTSLAARGDPPPTADAPEAAPTKLSGKERSISDRAHPDR